MRCRGHERYAGELLYCPSIAGRLRGLDRAMAVSCNVAFANLGVRVGRDRLLAEFQRYGFDFRGFDSRGFDSRGFDSRRGPASGGRIVQACVCRC